MVKFFSPSIYLLKRR